ncbi:unnamed protein product [Chironomus riparius]|uniref:VWFA domain-containing protein n=1 Tax=Chironomus riparius TaxID=315576 RepID=A0A9N9WW86_9DIPT|nr:unnamed protein product [Chironomus riparius]
MIQRNCNMKFYIFLCLFIPYVVPQRIRIPQSLVHCYRGNNTEYFFPSSLPIFIDIVRKIEQAFPTSIDLRHLSSRLFHDLRIDGIQRSPFAVESDDITVYGVSGFMTNKNRVLQQVISKVSGDINYEELLTPTELCILHKLMSSSVEPYEQMNELRICPRDILNTTSDQSIVRSKSPPLFIPNRRAFNNHTIVAPNFSRCPVELGVVYNDHGSFHPGVIIASIASGMQPQNIKIGDFVAEYNERDIYANLETMEDTDNRQRVEKMLSSLSSIDNTYAAGLVSDLAEVVLYQGAELGHNFSIGFPGLWNDTYFARCHHLNGSRSGFFHLTDSELLSGLDGLFISQQVASWSTRLRRLRLSQILEMYYLHQGISIPIIQTTNNNNFFSGRPNNNKGSKDEEKNDEEDPKFAGKPLFRKAFNYKVLNEELMDIDVNYLSRFSVVEGINSVCHRQKIIEMIDIDKLKDETYNFIQILEVVTKTPIITLTLLKDFSNTVVDRIMEYAKNLVASTSDCTKKPINIKKSRIDLTLIIDGSRSYYENLQLINYIAELIGVSRYGSYISVVHGNNGNYLANKTNNIADLFEQLRNSSFNVPFRLSILNSLSSVMTKMSEQLQEEKSSGSYMELSKVILLVSQSHRISQLDFENSQWLLRSSMLQFPDLYFVFLSNDVNTFQEMINGNNGNPVTSARMLIETAERYRFVDASSTSISTFEKSLESAITVIPKRIVSPFCHYENNNRTASYIRDEFEDYAMPNVDLLYRISPYYLLGSDETRVRFQGVGYGDLSVCTSRYFNMTDKECKSIQDIENVWFNITQPCLNHHVSDGCLGIYFSVSVETTYVRCSEYTCRFPDDVRFNVRPEGLRCETNSSPKNFIFSSTLTYVIVSFMVYLLKLS